MDEKKKRILISLWAYAYEIEDAPMVSDAEYDKLSTEIDPSITTGNEVLDKFFKEEFSPNTGMWVRKHPKLHKLKRLYKYLTAGIK